MNLIFDMDGTLIDSAKIALPAFEQLCPEYGLEIPTARAVKMAIGYSNPYFYYNIYPNAGRRKLKAFSEAVEKYENEHIQSFKDELLFDGVRELLLALKQKGMGLYIASTGANEHVVSCLRWGGIYELFDELHCGKPDKEIMIADIVKNEDKKKWIMVGDKRKDSKAAKYNGIYAVGAGYGYCYEEDYDQFNSIIKDPPELLDLINTMEHRNAI